MTFESSHLPSIGPVSASEQPAALQLLFSELAPASREAQIAGLLANSSSSPGQKQIFLAARSAGKLAGVVLLQIRPGRVAALFPPLLLPNVPGETATAMIDRALSQAAQQGTRLVHCLLDDVSQPAAAWLRSCGFQHSNDLQYMVCPATAFPATQPQSDLEFQPLDGSPIASIQLGAIMERTYQGSLDCPKAHNLQSTDDLLASFCATGNFGPAQWFIIRSAAAEIGCLMLTSHNGTPGTSPLPIPHSPISAWELLYMGLIPAARGHGYGLQIVRYAQWLARHSAAAQMDLAVDAANAPAIAVYSAAGFQTQSRRSVFLKTLTE